VKAGPWGILVMLVLVTALLSALLDNVTTVLLIVPVTLLITDALKVSAYPCLLNEIFAANIGGTATLIGDPRNIMIGSAVGLSFNDFLRKLGPLVALLLAGFVFAQPLNQQPATIAMFGAALLMLLQSLRQGAVRQARSVERTLAGVEWTTIFFFIGLFILVCDVESTGALEILAGEVLEATGSDPAATAAW
jgi:Na+/H+ antiporter NhaD/arsenite permease-like protein